MKSALRKLLFALVGVLIVVALVWAFWPKPVEVDIAPVTRGPLQVAVEDDGMTRIKERYVVSAPLTGLLLRVRPEVGDVVEDGQYPVNTSAFRTLATIQPTAPELLDDRARAQAQARVKAANASLERTDAELARAREADAFARKELERVRRLVASGRSLSEEEYDRARHQAHVATQDLNVARFAKRVSQFELEQAKAALLRTLPGDGQSPQQMEIPSPIDGKVLRVLQESSTVVTPGTRLLEVGDPSDLEVVVDLLSTDAVKVRKGAKVFLEHWGGEAPLPGTVRLVEPSGFTKVSALGVEEQRVNVIIDFLEPPGQRPNLGDAFRVEARILVWEGADVLQVPAGALFRRGDGWAVFTAEGSRAHVRPVRVGHRNGLEAEILEGLTEGEVVVVHPSDKVEDGVALVPRKPGDGK
jgi:HlyD family secretion protein